MIVLSYFTLHGCHYVRNDSPGYMAEKIKYISREYSRLVLLCRFIKSFHNRVDERNPYSEVNNLTQKLVSNMYPVININSPVLVGILINKRKSNIAGPIYKLSHD